MEILLGGGQFGRAGWRPDLDAGKCPNCDLCPYVIIQAAGVVASCAPDKGLSVAKRTDGEPAVLKN